MHILVNEREITLVKGMTVRHALTAFAGESADSCSWLVRDQWGNPIGLDGTLRDGDAIKAVIAHGEENP